MASQALAKKTRFKSKAEQKGYSVIRKRPAYTDKTQKYHPPVTKTYSAIDDVSREIKIHQLGLSGLDNNKNDGFRALLFPWDADVQEGDELKISNAQYTYQVTSADNPFQIGSEVVYWQVQCTRKSK